MNSSTLVYRLANDVLSVDTDEETIILTYGAAKYFGVRGAIRHLIEKLRQNITLEEMVREMSTHFGISAETARGDLEEILPKLTAAGIVVDGTAAR